MKTEPNDKLRCSFCDRKNGTRAMAREFGVSHASIGAVVHGESHKVAGEPKP